MTDDIAALIERHSQVIDVPGDPLSKETIVALRTLAQENERLKTPRTPPDFENILDGASKIQKRRIIEIEAEREQIKSDLRAAGIDPSEEQKMRKDKQ